MTLSIVEYQNHSGTAVIRLNRPEKKNALDLTMYGLLNDYLDTAQNDNRIAAVIITGHEDFFTTGNDIQDFVSVKSLDDLSIISDFIFKIANYTKPLIAAVNGPCVGIGTTLLLHCDLVYAGHQSYFHMPFSQLGLTPEAGASYLLPKLMGHQKASQYLLLGEPFDAKTALQLGLVNALVEKQDVLAHAIKKTEVISTYSPAAIQATKQLLKKSQQDITLSTIKEELPIFFNLLQQPYTQTVFKSFLNKSHQD